MMPHTIQAVITLHRTQVNQALPMEIAQDHI